MEKIDLVYVNGDSYVSKSTDFKIYGEHIADYANAEYINRAVPGSSNSRIFRTSLRDLIKLKKENKNILACISLSFLHRTELWDANHQLDRFKNSADGDFFSIQPTIDQDWYKNIKNFFSSNDSIHHDFSKNFMTWYNVEAETVKLFEKIILFKEWCKNNNIRYIIFSPMFQEIIDFDAPFVKDFYNEIANDTNILNPYKFSFLEWCYERNHCPIDDYTNIVNGKTYKIGHMGKSGHEDFAHFLIKKYIKS